MTICTGVRLRIFAGGEAEAGEQAVQLPDGDVQRGCARGDNATGLMTNINTTTKKNTNTNIFNIVNV